MSDDRLMRAMRASGAPARDPRFALLVLERAEKERFRRAGLRAALRGARRGSGGGVWPFLARPLGERARGFRSRRRGVGGGASRDGMAGARHRSAVFAERQATF